MNNKKPSIQIAILTLICVPLASVAAIAQDHLSPKELQKLRATENSSTLIFEESDSAALRIAKTAKCVPHPRQLAWQQLEFTCFIHFGINTFTGREWGQGMEDPALFNPSQVDTDQWCRTAKSAGMKMMLITVKHHDGYCLWQTRYNTEFSVRKSPWKNGRGDVLGQLAKSCKKHGLKLGVYLSPADLFQIEHKDGLYGNDSQYQDTTIPTDPTSFKSNPSKGRRPPSGKPTFNFKVDDYNRYMLNQLYECLTEYGPIDEVWFDGAHPKRKGDQKYTEELWFDMIHTLAPNATIAVGGPDVRWCGNESGGTRQSEWSPIPLNGDPAKRNTWVFPNGKNEQFNTIGGKDQLVKSDFVRWWPSEVDTSIRHGWFWRDESQHVRSTEEVFDVYERSVGSNSLLLLNVPPNRDGVFAARDSAVLQQIGKRIRATYAEAATGLSENDGIYTFDEPTTINRVVIMENIATHGQRIAHHAIDAWQDGQWKQVGEGHTIGYKRILRVPDTTTSKIRLRILKQRLPAKISHVSVHLDRAPLKAPSITRNRSGAVTVSGNGEIHYTLDGKEPSAQSSRYTKPLPLPTGGIVKAIAIRDNETSETVNARFDIAKEKWKIHHVSSHNPGTDEGAAMAIDGDPTTIWHSKWSGGTDELPHSIAIDLGEDIDIKGFTYLPRIGSQRGGILDQYKFEVSSDGRKWVTASKDSFDNIANDPTQREIRFAKVQRRIRYVRLTGIHSIENKPHSSAAEIGVITQ